MITANSPNTNGHFRRRLGLILTLIGLLTFILGAVPGLFGLDRSPVIGFVQIAVFLIGLGIICLGGYVLINSLWNSTPKTIKADIGLRLVSTGYVIALVSGMADVFGFGSQVSPDIPYYGPWQQTGVLIGEAVIALGFILQVPFRLGHRSASTPADNKPHNDTIQMAVK
jgi:uncharacterized membrane protein